MCFRPLHITNNSLHYNSHAPAFYDVPCGHCEECKDVRRLDWFVRSYYEYLDCQRKNGISLFYTLTFDDAHLPVYSGKRCFDKTIFQKFIKRLRVTTTYDFRYLACPEFGETYGRPHYHVVFHVFNHGETPLAMNFYADVLASWQQGFIHVKKGSSFGCLLHVKALRYATKYCVKDLLGWDSFWLNYSMLRESYLFFLRFYPLEDYSPRELYDCLRKSPTFFDDITKYYRSLRNRYLPSLHYSLGYGSPALDYLSSSNIMNEDVTIPQGNGFGSCKMPRFLVRKLFYDRVPNENDGKKTIYVLNERGFKHYNAGLENRISRLSSTYESFYMTPPSYDSYLNVRPYLLKVFGISFVDYDAFRDYFQQDKEEFRRMAIYNLCYRYIPLHQDIQGFDYFMPELYHYQWYNKVALKAIAFNDKKRPKLSREDISSSLYTNYVFEREENLLRFFEIVSNCQSQSVALLKAKREKDKRLLADHNKCLTLKFK